MGDSTMKRLPPLSNVIDYAHSEYRSDRMDVFLCGRCTFFVGAASGLSALASIFGIPVGLANLAPFSMALPPSKFDRGITKLYWSEKEKRLMTFKEIFESESSNYRWTSLFADAGIKLIDNTEDEIKKLFDEMCDLTINSNTSVANKDNFERQVKFKNLMRPCHFTYGALGSLGEDFLRKHQSLI
jgi:putative glycosyltransferase (TIGR04372 family)